METTNERAGFLCNFEILSALKEQRDARAAQIKSLNSNMSSLDITDEKNRIRPENLHTVTFECIKYLEEIVHPLRRQTATSITTALNDLEKLDLTKSERLQIINLAPANLCELTVCIEECEIRFPEEEQRDAILGIVKRSSSGLETAASGTGLKREDDHIIHPEEEEEDLEAHQDHQEEEEEFVNEGLAGEGEANVRELDEE